MGDFVYEDLFSIGEDNTEYRLLTDQYVSESTFNGKKALIVEPEALELLAEQAFKDVAHMLRPSHLALLQQIFKEHRSVMRDHSAFIWSLMVLEMWYRRYIDG